MTKTRIFGMMLALALLVGAFTIGAPQNAQALPSNQVTTTYFSDASLTTQVGVRVLLCQGGYYNEGIRTPYYTIESELCSDIFGH